MASLRILNSAVTTDAISTRNIRLIDVPSVVNMWASCVTVTDEIGLNLGSITLMAAFIARRYGITLGVRHSR